MVHHGDLWQSRQTGCAPQPTEEQAQADEPGTARKKKRKKKVADDEDEGDVDLDDLDDDESAADALAGVHVDREIEEREVIVEHAAAHRGHPPASHRLAAQRELKPVRHRLLPHPLDAHVDVE